MGVINASRGWLQIMEVVTGGYLDLVMMWHYLLFIT
jgi:hypothetical protein